MTSKNADYNIDLIMKYKLVKGNKAKLFEPDKYLEGR